MSNETPAPGATETTIRRDPHGWRAGLRRVVANALLVLFAYAIVTVGAGAAQLIFTGWAPTLPSIQFVVFVAAFLLIRWLFVLPGLLLVLVGLEFVARRTPFARVVFLLVAFGPMVWWELTQGSGDTSGFTGLLGLTAVLFAVLARLPTRTPGPSSDDLGAAQPPAETAVAPR